MMRWNLLLGLSLLGVGCDKEENGGDTSSNGGDSGGDSGDSGDGGGDSGGGDSGGGDSGGGDSGGGDSGDSGGDTGIDTGDSGDGGGVPTDISGLLTRTGGCADVYLYASDDTDSSGLFFYVDKELLLSLYFPDEPDKDEPDTPAFAPPSATYTWKLPHPDIQILEFQTGLNVTHMACNDALWKEMRTDETYYPLSGTLTLTLTATSDEATPYNYPGTAEAVFTDVTFSKMKDMEYDVLILPSFTLSASVGWFPG